MPLFNQESKNIMIREELYFFNQFVMFFKTVTKLVRNSYEYLWNSAWLSLNHQDAATIHYSVQKSIWKYCNKVRIRWMHAQTDRI